MADYNNFRPLNVCMSVGVQKRTFFSVTITPWSSTVSESHSATSCFNLATLRSLNPEEMFVLRVYVFLQHQCLPCRLFFLYSSHFFIDIINFGARLTCSESGCAHCRFTIFLSDWRPFCQFIRVRIVRYLSNFQSFFLVSKTIEKPTFKARF